MPFELFEKLTNSGRIEILASGRFRLHTLVNRFLRKKILKNESRLAAEKYALHFKNVAAFASENYQVAFKRTATSQSSLFSREFHNIRTAFLWASNYAPDLACEFIVRCHRLLIARLTASEKEKWGSIIAKTAAVVKDWEACALGNYLAGFGLLEQGRCVSAVGCFDKAQLYFASLYFRSAASARNKTTEIAEEFQREHGRDSLSKLVPVTPKSTLMDFLIPSNSTGITESLLCNASIARIFVLLGHLDLAVRMFRVCLEATTCNWDLQLQLFVLDGLGDALLRLSKPTLAYACYRKAEMLIKMSPGKSTTGCKPQGHWLVLFGKGRALILERRFAHARRLLRQSLRKAKDTGNRNLEAQSAFGLGLLAAKTQNFAFAERQLLDASLLANEQAIPLLYLETQLALWRLYLDEGELRKARTIARTAIAIKAKIQGGESVVDARNWLRSSMHKRPLSNPLKAETFDIDTLEKIGACVTSLLASADLLDGLPLETVVDDLRLPSLWPLNRSSR